MFATVPDVSFLDLGAAGILAILVLREARAIIAQARNRKAPEVDWALLAAQTRELHQWHDHRDQEGVPLWFVRKSLEDVVVTASENIAKQTEVLRELCNEVKALSNPDCGQTDN